MNKLVSVYIVLGSSLKKETSILDALTALEIAFGPLVCSRFYEFPAVEADGSISRVKPSFANGAVRIETSLSFKELHGVLRGIEESLGRVRTEDKFAPRIIDIDILIYDGKVVDRDALALKHVSVPLREILPL